MKYFLTFLFLQFIQYSIFSQVNFIEGVPTESDKCGYIEGKKLTNDNIALDNWGYGYDSLITDLNLWGSSPYVKIDSIGLSVQNRVLWRLIISEDPENISDKRTVHVHARTHPQETEGFWVTREIINILLSENELAQTIRANCVFYIVPMYNPDGVELETTRYNANGVDLESNWNTFPHEPEVEALKASFVQLMSQQNPIEVALNMHSSSLCERYFVYHHQNGTSPAYALLEQQYIGGVRSYYPSGIEPYTYFVSWVSGTALQYPESWFWLNHGENVMALTYEDMYQCSFTGNFNVTADAILRGTMDYMGIVTDAEGEENIPAGFTLNQNYPNPFNPVTNISYSIPTSGHVNISVYDLLGNEVALLVNEEKPSGKYDILFNGTNLSSGIYFYTISVSGHSESKKMTLLK